MTLETEDAPRCADCGASVPPVGGRGYSVSADQVLCWDCAVRRGGAYDEVEDAWATRPRAHDLVHEEDQGRIDSPPVFTQTELDAEG